MSADGSADWLLDQVIGNYRIISSIGQGGMGSVYFATHEVLGRHAAVKVLLPEFTGNAELVTRFFREARATSKLRHRAFVEIFDSGRLGDGSAYLVMDYLRGESLAGYLHRIGPLPVDDALAIARDLAEGVGFANGHGIVHRDLKPDNVFLRVEEADTGQPGGAAVKVLDFGIAKLMGESDGKGKGTAQTRMGALLGTPLYMAPEQCRGAGQTQIDQRADLYAFGCIVHEMLTGEPPFPLEGFGEIISAQLSTPPPPLRTLRAEVPPSVEALVLSLLAKQPSARPPDMAAVVGAIDSIRAELAGRRGVTIVGAGSVARLPVLVPPLPVASGPRPSRAPSAPGRSPFPFAAGSGPALARTTPAVDLVETGRGDSAGGTKLLPTPAEGARSGSRRGSGAGYASMSTLGAGAGEMHGGRTERRGSGRRNAIVVLALVAGGGIAAAAFKLTSTPSASLAGAPGRTGVELQAAEPIVTPPPPRRAPPLDPAADADPPRHAKPKTVTVRINSEPMDASLVDARTGAKLGHTPFLRDLPRATEPMTVTVRKGGYRSKQINVDLDQNTALDIKLEHKPASSSPSKPGEDDDYRKM